jgi:ribosomal protein L29
MIKEEYKENREKGLSHLNKLLGEIKASKVEELMKLIATTPNDTDLGREVRKLFSK